MRFSLNNADLILLGGSDFEWHSRGPGAAPTPACPGRRSSKPQRAQIERVIDLEIVEDGTDQNVVAAWNSESGDNIGGALRSTDNGAPGLILPLVYPGSSAVPGCALRLQIRKTFLYPHRLVFSPAASSADR